MSKEIWPLIFAVARLASVGVIGAAAPPLSWAQSRLSLQEAVQQAIESRPSLQAEAARVSASEATKFQAGLWPNPEFQFQNENLRPGQTYGRDVDTLAIFSQPIDVLGKRKQRVAVANETLRQTRAEYQLARWQIAQNVKLAYWAARGAQDVRDMLQRTIDAFQKIVDYNAAQFSAGAIAEQDLLRVRLERERLNVSADLASIEVNHAQVELLRQMGQTDFSKPVTLTDSLDPQRSVTPVPIQQVLDRRLDIAVTRAALSEAEANAKLQGVLARPDLSITTGYKRTQLPDAIDSVNTAVAGLRITLPLRDRNQGNRAAAAAEVRRREQLLAEEEGQIRADYADALQEYESRRAELTQTLQPIREHAATLSQIAAAAYREGGTDLLRLLDAERARLDAELAWIHGLVDYQQSIVRLEAAEGVN